MQRAKAVQNDKSKSHSWTSGLTGTLTGTEGSVMINGSTAIRFKKRFMGADDDKDVVTLIPEVLKAEKCA